MKNSKQGFTLIELLVVVLIIGVLAAIALPQYNKAVARSRFNALMPIAKAMSDANEAYYLEHGHYGNNPQDLPVEGKTEYPTGTTLELSGDPEYAYVRAQNSSVPSRYVMYQKHSANYPGEIHCEAEEDNALAQSICEGVGGNQELGEVLEGGYITYVLSGTGAGIAPGANDNSLSCDSATTMGYTCNITTNEEGQTVKQICNTLGTTSNYCRTKTYNEDGSYTSVTCEADGSNGENVCTSSWYSATYDANGNKLSQRICSSVDSSGNCTAYNNNGTYYYTYDANGNQLTQRECTHVDNNGNCTSYQGYNYDYTYDANGNQLTRRHCNNSQLDSSLNCTAYSNYYASNNTYDANGNMLTDRSCSSVDSSSGNCTAYTSGSDYTYDANGKKLQQRYCSGSNIDNSGNCTAYSLIYDYMYDENGNLTKLYCNGSKVDSSSGNCTAYTSGYKYTYDANGNMLTEAQCSSVDSSGACMGYYNSFNYTYDANGNMLTKQYCKTTDPSTGNCTSYQQNSYVYTYDDNGKQIAYQYCNGSNLNTATGECIAYSYTSVSSN